jgi:hypothetical protein
MPDIYDRMKLIAGVNTNLYLLLHGATIQQNTNRTFVLSNTKSYVGSKEGKEKCAQTVNVDQTDF